MQLKRISMSSNSKSLKTSQNINLSSLLEFKQEINDKINLTIHETKEISKDMNFIAGENIRLIFIEYKQIIDSLHKKYSKLMVGNINLN